jgi:hypothetical protein
MRTILALLINNIDPVMCGFPLTSQTLNHIKNTLRYDIFFGKTSYIKKYLDMENLIDLHGSKKFFHWFKQHSFNKKEKIIMYTLISISRKVERSTNRWVKYVHCLFQKGYLFL